MVTCSAVNCGFDEKKLKNGEKVNFSVARSNIEVSFHSLDLLKKLSKLAIVAIIVEDLSESSQIAKSKRN